MGMTALVKGNRLQDAQSIFDSLREQGVRMSSAAYNTLLNALRKEGGNHERIEYYHKQMVDDGIPFDTYTYTQLIRSQGDLHDWKGAVSLFHRMLDKGIEPNPFVCSAVFHACRQNREFIDPEAGIAVNDLE